MVFAYVFIQGWVVDPYKHRKKVAIPSATNPTNQIAVTNVAVPTVILGKTSAHTMW